MVDLSKFASNNKLLSSVILLRASYIRCNLNPTIYIYIYILEWAEFHSGGEEVFMTDEQPIVEEDNVLRPLQSLIISLI